MVSTTVHGTDAVNIDVEVHFFKLSVRPDGANIAELRLVLPSEYFTFVANRFAQLFSRVEVTVANNAAVVDISTVLTKASARRFCPEALDEGAPLGRLRVRISCVTDMLCTTMMLDVVRGRAYSPSLHVICKDTGEALEYPSVSVVKGE